VNLSGQVTTVTYTGPVRRETRIVASAENRADTIRLFVNPLLVSRLELPDTIRVEAGATAQANAKVTSAAGVLLSQRSISFRMTDTTTATISADGTLSAIFFPGLTVRNTMLIATIDQVQDSAQIVVVPATVRSIRITTDTVTYQALGPIPDPRLVQASSPIKATTVDERGNIIERNLFWQIADTSIAKVMYSPRSYTTIKPTVYVGPHTRKTKLVASFDTAADTIDVIIRPIPVASTGIPRSVMLHPNAMRKIGPTMVVDSFGTTLPERQTEMRTTDGTLLTFIAPFEIKALAIGNATVLATTANRIDTISVDIDNWSSVSVGLQPCALTTQGKAYCWGSEQLGMLGSKTTSPGLWPTKVETDTVFEFLSSGYASTCGLSKSGTVMCWGRNDFRALGIPNLDSVIVPSEGAGRKKFKRLSDGIGQHRCGIDFNDDLWCWGYSAHGQLGNGTIQSGTCYLPSCFQNFIEATPQRVLTASKFSAVTTSLYSTCGITLDKRILCWGMNSSGQLGDSTFTSRATPAPIRSSDTFESVSATWSAVCALNTAKRIVCWGDSVQGLLGNGYLPNTTVSPEERSQPVPTQIKSSELFQTLETSCGISIVDEAYCWGPVAGLGPTEYAAVPVRQNVPYQFGNISRAGNPAMMCGVTTTGYISCWGDNRYGQLGDGSQLSRNAWGYANSPPN
jgi:alpha-tubulin suppressor-like RCC1 family protein